MTDNRNSRRHDRPVLGPDDYMRRRRERRMRRTQQSEAEVRAWAERYGLALRVLNNGHHWILDKSGFIAEWWPSSAKLALNRDYHRSFRAPHWPDVLVVLERTFARSPVTS